MWHRPIGIIAVLFFTSYDISLHAMQRGGKWIFGGHSPSKPINPARPPKPTPQKEQAHAIFQRERASATQPQSTLKSRLTNFLYWRPSFTFAPMLRFFFGPPQAEIIATMWQTFETIELSGWHYDRYKIPDIERYKPYINSPRSSDGKTILTIACEACLSIEEQNIQRDILRYIKLFIKLGANFGNNPHATLLNLLQNKYRILELVASAGNENQTNAIKNLFTNLDAQLKEVAQNQKLNYAAIDTQALLNVKTVITPNQPTQKPALPEE